MSIGLMELEESAYWLELLQEGKVWTSPEVASLHSETDERCAIFVSMIKKVRQGIPGTGRRSVGSEP